jgi:hypothetical protein
VFSKPLGVRITFIPNQNKIFMNIIKFLFENKK